MYLGLGAVVVAVAGVDVVVGVVVVVVGGFLSLSSA